MDSGVVLLAGTTLAALVAAFTVPSAYERHLSDQRHRRYLRTLLQMNSGTLPRIPRRVRARTSLRVRTETAASPVHPPGTGLAAAAPKHRRAE